MEIKRIEELHRRGIVSFAGLERAKIIVRYAEIRKKHKTNEDAYFALSIEFNKSEYTIRNIILGCR